MQTKMPSTQKALLALADGSVFYGVSLGLRGSTVGEVVFNTAMSGYQEILTDPSYCKQIVTFTYPHIGNVGVNPEDVESKQLWVAGLIIRDYPKMYSNWRSDKDLDTYLAENKIVGITEIDTRALTRLLREKGAIAGCITSEVDAVEAAIEKARAFSGLNNAELATSVTTAQPYTWTAGSWQTPAAEATNYHVVVYDYGVKYSILRQLVDRGCLVTVVPATFPYEALAELKPNGVVLSNGPGDPAACQFAIDTAKKLLDSKLPVLGICLGFQILGLASGAQTRKMAYGHHGANHPIQDIRNKKVIITSQNHGFCVEETTLPDHIEVTHRSLFDGTLQGFRFKHSPVLAMQGHPEAGPGPQEAAEIFDEFIHMMS